MKSLNFSMTVLKRVTVLRKKIGWIFTFVMIKFFFTKIDWEDIYLYLKQEPRFIHIGLETVDNNDYKKDYGKIAEEELSNGRIFHQIKAI